MNLWLYSFHFFENFYLIFIQMFSFLSSPFLFLLLQFHVPVDCHMFSHSSVMLCPFLKLLSLCVSFWLISIVMSLNSFIFPYIISNLCYFYPVWVFPIDSVVKNPLTNAGDAGSIPGSGRPPGGGNGNPLQYSWLGNPVDRGAWWATVHGVSKNQIWLNNSVHIHL